MSKYKKCVDKIRASAADKEISEAEAERLLGELDQKFKAAQSKRSMQREDALRKIAGEIFESEKRAFEVAQRSALLNVQRFRQGVNFAMKDMKRSPGKGLELYLRAALSAMNAVRAQLKLGLQSKFEEHDVWNFVRKASRDDFKAFWLEADNISRGNTDSITGNKSAHTVAKLYFDSKREGIALTNRAGGDIQEAPGHVFVQTWDYNKLRRAGANVGVGRFIGWGKASQDASYAAFKADILAARPDWERIGVSDPEAQEKWMRGFHRNIYTMEHSKTEGWDVDAMPQERGRGTLSQKLSAERKLWFKDAEGAFAIHEKYGAGGTLHDAIMHQVDSFAKNASLMQYFGPDHANTFKNIKDYLTVRSKEFDDSDRRIKSLNGLDEKWEVLNGRHRISERPGLSSFVDGVAEFIMLAKAPGLVLSTPVDLGVLDTAMAYRGFTAIERFQAQVKAIAVRSDDERQTFNDMAVSMQAYTGAAASSWSNDVQTGGVFGKALHKVFDITQFNKRNEMIRYSMSQGMASRLASYAGKSFDQLHPDIQRTFGEFEIGPKAWDVWRRHVGTVKGTDGESYAILGQDVAGRLTDEDLSELVLSQGLSDTKANRDRARDTFNAKTRAYFFEAVEDASTGPTLGGTALMTGGGAMRGTGGRELGRLFWMLKGYSINAAYRTVERERSLTGSTSFKEWATENGGGGYMRLAAHIGKLAVLGALVTTISDLKKGATPRKPIMEDGSLNLALWKEYMARGGGAAILGDVMLNEYDKRYRNFAEAIAGPALGEVPGVFDMAADVFKAIDADTPQERDTTLRGAGYALNKMVRQNMPLSNLPIVRSVMDHLIFYSIAEGFAPGVARRQAKALQKQERDYWLDIADPRERQRTFE